MAISLHREAIHRNEDILLLRLCIKVFAPDIFLHLEK